jgi:hypothetical protein
MPDSNVNAPVETVTVNSLEYEYIYIYMYVYMYTHTYCLYSFCQNVVCLKQEVLRIKNYLLQFNIQIEILCLQVTPNLAVCASVK